MLIAFNQMTLGRPCPLAEVAPAVRAAGFDGMELSIEQADALARDEGAAALDRALRGLAPINFGLPVEWRESPERFDTEFAGLDRLAGLAAALGHRRCCTWVPPESPLWRDRYARVAAERLAGCAETLDRHGITLALEYLAPHHLVSHPDRVWFQSVEGAMRAGADLAARTAGAGDWGLVLDAMHMHISGLIDRDLTGVPVRRIHNVQLCDAPHDADGREIPRERLRNNDSRLPGSTGVIDSVRVVRALDRIGYRGPVSVEVFDPAQAVRTVREVVEDAFRGLTAVFEAAGVDRSLPRPTREGATQW